VGGVAVAVGGPDQALAVGGEHGEAIEIGMEGDALLVGAVFVDDVEIEVATIFWIGLIGGEDDAVAIGEKVRTEVGGAVVGDLMLVRAVGVHDPDFEIAWTDEALSVELFVIFYFLRSFGVLGAIDNFGAVVRPEGAAIVAEFFGELADVGAIGIHGENIEITVAGGGEDDVLAVASDGGFGIVARGVGELVEIGTIGIGDVDLVGAVDGPNVAARIIGLGRAIGTGGVGGGEKNFIAGGKKVAAGGAAFAGADEFGDGRLAVGRVDGHGVNLIAGDTFALVLKDELFVVGGEIGFGVLAAEGELADVFEVFLFLGEEEGGVGSGGGVHGVAGRVVKGCGECRDGEGAGGEDFCYGGNPREEGFIAHTTRDGAEFLTSRTPFGMTDG
jgi:hypothetical protein